MIGLASEQLIVLAILLPIIASVLIVLTDKQPNLREAITLVTASIVAFVVITLSIRVQAGEVPVLELFEVVPGIKVSFTIEPLGMLFALVAGTLWLVTSIYAVGYMRGHHEKNQTPDSKNHSNLLPRSYQPLQIRPTQHRKRNRPSLARLRKLRKNHRRRFSFTRLRFRNQRSRLNN